METLTQETEELLKELDIIYNNPWAMYIDLTGTEVIEVYNKRGFEEAKELIRRTDIFAYRAEEAACDNI
jgi:hypothetical protein